MIDPVVDVADCLAESVALSAVSLVDSAACFVLDSILEAAAEVSDWIGALALASGSADAAIEFSPCWDSVAPPASGSDWVAASSLANLRCVTR